MLQLRIGRISSMKRHLQQFMLGRYGNDDLNRIISITALVAMFISLIVGRATLYPFSLTLLILCFFRMLSKNTMKRSGENQVYLRLRGKIARKFRIRRDRFRQRKTHCFYKCPSCRANLRVPKGRGLISITCSQCHTSFQKKT